MAFQPPLAGHSTPSFRSIANIVLSDEEENLAHGVPLKGRNMARLSKVAAAYAITARSPADQEGPHPAAAPQGRKNPLRKHVGARRSPGLDFSTLRTSSPRYLQRPPTTDRLFGLQHAPIYYPTIEEFASPIDYISSISEEAKQSGICKIVPPVGWKPSFAIDTETFRFKTRLQQLNSMEASARASINFLEQLHLFHEQQGHEAIDIPIVEEKPLDLWRLRKELNLLGGYTAVTADRKWVQIAKAMQYDPQTYTTLCPILKETYARLVIPFESFIAQIKTKNPAGNLPDLTTFLSTAFAKQHSNPNTPDTPKDTSGADSLATPNSEHAPDRKTAQTINEEVKEASAKLNEVLQVGAQDAGIELAAGLEAALMGDEVPGDMCEICTLDHDPDKIVLCDTCDRGYHLSCISPPLLRVPSSKYYCDECLLMEGADYGFEEGQEHSLWSFRRKADAFKREWLEDHPLPLDKGKGRFTRAESEDKAFAEQLAIEDHVEREFWRLVESTDETVEVEYGADIDASKDGGAFPNLEVHPNDPYSRDGWNLNNLPILAGSLLRYIKSDISGMSIPWMYVGGVFSTFAYHMEDHYTYSINYHHWGDTKTWYGLPDVDGDKLEATMRLAAPELFAQQPDLLYQLVTLMSPGRLKENGVRVVACDQRPGEFVVTFPKAYHSGFNHGFNFNEAVNFALPDWLPSGLECVQRYQAIKKNPVFSHDELLMTVAQHEKSPAQSVWLYPSLQEMVSREIASRNTIRAQIPGLKETVDDSELGEEEYQCEQCKILCYLAQVTLSVKDASKIACADHHALLGPAPKTMWLRYSDEELLSTLAKVKARADKVAKPVSAQTRTTGRKRKPSSFSMESTMQYQMPLDESIPDSQSPPAQRAKFNPAPLEVLSSGPALVYAEFSILV